MTQTTFNVQPRSETKPQQLRREGIVPANIFGGGDSIAIQMEDIKFQKLYEEVGETGLVYIDVEGDKEQHPVLVEEVQSDPVSGSLVHVSFKKVDLTEKVQAQIPIETVGEFDVPEAVLVVVKDEVEVEALPANLPESFVVDISILSEIGQTITLESLDYDREKVGLVLGEEGEEEPIVVVQQQQEEEPEEEPEVEEGEEGEAAESEETEGEEGDKEEAKDEDKPEEKSEDKKED